MTDRYEISARHKHEVHSESLSAVTLYSVVRKHSSYLVVEGVTSLGYTYLREEFDDPDKAVARYLAVSMERMNLSWGRQVTPDLIEQHTTPKGTS